MYILHICNSCSKINAGVEDLEAFHQEILEGLKTLRPDIQWKVEPSPCLKLCPLDRISMTVTNTEAGPEAQLTLARQASSEAVIAEALSFLKTNISR